MAIPARDGVSGPTQAKGAGVKTAHGLVAKTLLLGTIVEAFVFGVSEDGRGGVVFRMFRHGEEERGCLRLLCSLTHFLISFLDGSCSYSSMASTDERLFSERDEWKDVQPVEQYETVNPLAPIFYTAEYSDATGYLRAIVQSGEKSLRVLELTENVIRQNPAHYSAWQYRYETLLALLPATTDPLPPLLESELVLLDTLSIEFLKTYQVWHHRRLLLLLTHRVSHELDFIKRGLLNVDNKNYHTWSYRQWILAHFCTPDDDLWAAELDFVDTMLVQDLRNNSAWHHRFFIVWAHGVLNGDDVKRREIIYTKQNISLAPSNPSAWNYLRGVLTHTKTPFSELVPFALMYTRPAVHPTVIDLDNPGPGESAQLPCVYALEFVADAWEAQARELLSEKNQAAEELIQKAVTMWEALGTEWDVVRKKYWEYRIREAHLALG